MTALRPTFEHRPGTWIGWDGALAGRPAHAPRPRRQARPRLTPQVGGRGLLPRLLEPDALAALPRARRPRRHRPTLVARLHARERALRRAGARGDDAGLAPLGPRLPARLRAGDCCGGQARRQPIGFFLHIPFPAPELFARLPWRQHLIDGMLGADAIAFQTEEYRQNFVRTCLRLQGRRDRRTAPRLRLADGRAVLTTTHPISIDAEGFRARARSEADPGALARLAHAVRGPPRARRRRPARLHEGNRRAPARDRAPARAPPRPARAGSPCSRSPCRAAATSASTASCAPRSSRSSAGSTAASRRPARTCPSTTSTAASRRRGCSRYYGVADVCLVTPLRDGMNLVAKEFVDLPRMRSAAPACSCSASSPARPRSSARRCPATRSTSRGSSGAIELALELDEDDRRYRIERLARRDRPPRRLRLARQRGRCARSARRACRDDEFAEVKAPPNHQ